MKKIIDGHGRIFGKLSIIDVFVLLIILVIGASLYVKYTVLDVTNLSGGAEPIVYTVTIYGVREYTVNGLQIDDLLYDKNSSGNTIGTITNISTQEAKKAASTTDGMAVLGRFEDHYDVTLTISASGATSDGRYLVNKTYELNANSSRLFNTKFCTFKAIITGIE